eukprot:469556-Amorphochlora_amoeboformis.AAC.2
MGFEHCKLKISDTYTPRLEAFKYASKHVVVELSEQRKTSQKQQTNTRLMDAGDVTFCAACQLRSRERPGSR